MTRRSPSRRTAPLLAPVLVATAAAMASGGVAVASPPPPPLDTVDVYTGLSFTVPAGTNDLGQPQTCAIDADLYKPHSASQTRRVPAILTTNGFGGAHRSATRGLTPRGY